jgi:hypothetical protein
MTKINRDSGFVMAAEGRLVRLEPAILTCRGSEPAVLRRDVDAFECAVVSGGCLA